MKKKLQILFLSALAFSTVPAGAQLINPGFETWSSNALVASANDPNNGNGTTGWWDYNFYNNSFLGSSPISVTKCTDTVHSGIYSARIQSVIYSSVSHGYNSPWGTPFIGHPYLDTLGILFNGNTDVTTKTYKPGIPFTQKITQFSFYYQYKPNGVDSAECRIALMNSRTIVAGGLFKTSKATGSSGWQQAIINMVYVSALNPDTMYVLFSSSSLDIKPKPGSILWIDDVSVTLSSGINQVVPGLNEMQVYPDPAIDFVNFHIQGLNTIALLSIFDITGQKIDNILVQNEFTAINTQAYRKGLYFYRLYDNSGSISRSGKFSVTAR